MYVPLAPALALFGIYASRSLPTLKRYLLSGGFAVVLCSVAAWYYNHSSELVGMSSVYVGIFMDLLPNSSTPEQDLAELGLDPKLVAYIGTTPFGPDSALANANYSAELSAKLNSLILPVFYATHPRRLYDLCARCMQHAFSTRVRRIGYYEESGHKRPRTQPIGIWSIIRENVFPRSVLFVGFFFATGFAALGGFFKETSTRLGSLSLLYLLFLFIAVLQFFVAVLLGGGEPDLEKHLFMFNLAFDACFVLAALGLAHYVQTSWPFPLIRKMLRAS
jgi:hypothetical protein